MSRSNPKGEPVKELKDISGISLKCSGPFLVDKFLFLVKIVFDIAIAGKQSIATFWFWYWKVHCLLRFREHLEVDIIDHFLLRSFVSRDDEICAVLQCQEN